MSASLFISSARVDGFSLILSLGVQGSPVESYDLELKDPSGRLELANADFVKPENWLFDKNYQDGVLALTGFSMLSPISAGNLLELVVPIIDAPASQPLALSWSGGVNDPTVQVAGGLVAVAENAASSGRVKLADLNLGQSAALAGSDAGSFELSDGDLYVKSGTDLNYEADPASQVIKNSYDFSIAVDGQSQAWRVSVLDVNEAPVLSSGSSASVAENAATSALVYQAVASDVDAGATLSYSLSGADAAKFTIDAAGAVRLNAAADYETQPSYAITVEVSDGTLSASQAVSVSVIDVNEAPTASHRSVTFNEDQTRKFALADFGFSDVDAGNSLQSVKITTLEAKGALKLNGADVTLNQVIKAADIAAGKLAYTPLANGNGAAYANFGFKVSDGTAMSTSAYQMTLNVTTVNDAPTASNRAVTLNEDTTKAFALADFGFSDVDAGDSLQSITVTTLESKGALKLNGADVTLNQVIKAVDIAAGKLAYTPAADGNGAAYANFGFKVSDGTAMSTSAYQMTLNVAAVNDAPTLSSFGTSVKTGNEDTAVSISLAELISKGNEADMDGIVTAFVVKAVTSGTLKIGTSAASATAWNVTTNHTIDGTKSAFWTPAANANGTLNAFTAVAKDNSGAVSATAVQAKVAVAAVRDDLTLTGTSGVDTLKGDTIDAGSYDKLSGLGGNDKLFGLAGNDTLIGGAGADQLTGGTGNDIFSFTALTDFGLGATARDVIADFKHGEDKIDLSAIDANLTRTGDQAFTWVTKFSATAGQVRFAADGNGNGIVYLNTDIDTAAEHEILLTGVTTLTAADFSL